MEYFRSYYDFRKPLVGGETTAQQLLNILQTTRVGFKRLPSNNNGSLFNLPYYRFHHNESVDCDEVFPNVYIGDGITARNKDYLRRLGITHVVNAAEGKHYGFVNTNKAFYKDTIIKYLGLPMADWASTDISQYFYSVSDFIEQAVASGGKVFVHCVQGVSRSATLVIAYLMIKKDMRAMDAVRIVRLSRNIYPNEGFLRQLAQLDNYLRRRRLL